LPRLERLEARLPPAAHDTLTTAIALTLDSSQHGHAVANLADYSQVDLYSVALQAGQQLTADVHAQSLHSSLHAALRIFDPAGTQLALADSYAFDPALSYDAATTGTFYIGVSRSGNDSYVPTVSGSGATTGNLTTGPYSLDVSVVTPATAAQNNTLSTALTITGNTSLSGSLQIGDTDFFRLTEQGPGRLTATATASSGVVLDPRLSLFDESGKLLIQSDEVAAGETIARLDQHLQPGTYFLEVSAARNTTNAADDHGYQLTTLFQAASPLLAALPTGISPESVAVADLTGNGIPDIVTSNEVDSTVSVLLGNGDGSFRPASSFPVGETPRSVAVADLNGDGIPDIVTANFNDDTVSVLLGNGDGSFRPAFPLHVRGEPDSVAVADLNGDGHADILTANRYDNSVSVLLGNGDGTFQPAIALAVGTAPTAVAVADLGNGHPDIITANAGSFPFVRTGSLSILMNNGDGTFQPPSTILQGIVPLSLAVADLGNGHPDIITADPDNNSVDVLLGNGDGTFQPVLSFPVGNEPFSVAVADVNGDGRPDIVCTNVGDNSMSVLLGKGDGSFQPALSNPLGSEPFSLAVTDVNGDGVPDVITANRYNSNVSVLLGNGDGTFRSVPSLVVGKYPQSVAVADINGDGHPDILTANAHDNTVSILLGNGDGTFRPAPSLPVGNYPQSVAVADLNGDGIPDVVTANRSDGTVSVLLGNGDGTFQRASSLRVGSGPVAVAVADVNGDGIPDIITANEFRDTVSVLLGNGDGSFRPAYSLGVGKEPLSVVVADLGNGHPDIVTANLLDSTASVLLGNGDGSFQPAFSLRAGDFPESVAVADLGNGHPDIITADVLNKFVSVLLGNGDGTFQSAFSLTVGSEPDSVAVADLTGNGIPDIVTTNRYDNTVSVLLGKGHGTFLPAFSIPVGRVPVSVAVAKLTGDGHLDIIAANRSEGSVSVLLGDGRGSFFPPTGQTSVSGQDVPVLAHVRGEGVPDALSLDEKTGQILFRAGTGNPSAPYAPFLVVNPGHPASEFSLVQTANSNRPEIAALDAGDDTVYLYIWTRTHSQNPFKLIDSFRTGGGPVRMAAADLTGGGPDDLVIANSFDSTLTIAFQLPSGGFNPNTLTRPIGASPSSISFADLNGQTVPPDIVVGDQASGDVTVLFNDREHTFASESRYRAGPGVFDVATSPTAGTTVASQLETVGVVAAPFSGAALPELLAVNRGTDSFSLLANLGGGSFADPSAATTFPLGNVSVVQVLLGDVTPDTTNDLAILTTDSDGNSQVRIYLHSNDGTFLAPIISDAGQDATGFSIVPGQPIHSVLVGPDQPAQPARLLVGNADGDFLTLTGDDSGHFTIDRSGLTGKPLAVGHTPDGRTFVVVTNAHTGQIQVFFQNPGGSPSGSSPFAAPVSLTSPAQTLFAPGAVQLADLNGARDAHGDPIEDLIVADRLGNDVLVYFGNADGSFPATPSYSISVGFEPSAVTVGDFNSDHVLDLAVANQGSNDVSILDGRLTKGIWTATHGPRLRSGGSEPIAISAGHFIHQNLLDLRVTNAGGQVAVLPGIGIRQGTGFFLANHPQTTSLGSTIVQAAFDPSTGAEFVVLQDGSLRSLGGADVIATGVEAVSATDGILIAGLTNGAVEVMTEGGADVQMQAPGFRDQPSALQALLSGNQIDVYASYQGQDAPVLFSFAVPVITQLPGTSAVALASGLSDTNLILAALLLQGNLVERVEVAAVESAPAAETFGAFAQATATRTAPAPLFQDAVVIENRLVEGPLVMLPDAEVPVEAPFHSFGIGVEEALRQWLRDQRPTPRIEGMLEGLERMLAALPESLDQPPLAIRAPAVQPSVEPIISVTKPDDAMEATEDKPWEETTAPPARPDEEVEVFPDVESVPVSTAAGGPLGIEEEETELLLQQWGVLSDD
jgi:hypothetical protein